MAKKKSSYKKDMMGIVGAGVGLGIGSAVVGQILPGSKIPTALGKGAAFLPLMAAGTTIKHSKKYFNF